LEARVKDLLAPTEARTKGKCALVEVSTARVVDKEAPSKVLREQLAESNTELLRATGTVSPLFVPGRTSTP